MKRSFPLSGSGPQPCASWRSERGFYTLALAIAISAGLLINWSLERLFTNDSAVITQADDCISKLHATNAAFKAAAIADSNSGKDPNEHELGLDDPGVVDITRCQNLLAQLVKGLTTQANDVKSEKVHQSLSIKNIVNDFNGIAVQGYTFQVCPLTDVKEACQAGTLCVQAFTAEVNFSGSSARGAATLGGDVPAGAFCKPITQKIPSMWLGKCEFPAAGSKDFDSSKSTTITVTASTAVVAPTSAIDDLNAHDTCPGAGRVKGCFDRDGTFQENPPRDPAAYAMFVQEKCSGGQVICLQRKDLDGNCPAGIFNPGQNYCAEACKGSASFTWKKATVPTVKLSADKGTVTPINPGDEVKLDYEIANAEVDASLVNVMTLLLTNGAAKGFTMVSPQKTTIYVLVANLTGRPDVASSPVTVKVNKPGVVTITSPANDAQITGPTVNVTGTVTAPDSGQSRQAVKLTRGGVEMVAASEFGTVQISVNGGGTVPATVNADGTFSATVPLQKVFTKADLFLTNPNTSVTSCGSFSTTAEVGALNTPDDVANVITATVIPPAPPAGAPATTSGLEEVASTASVTVFHAVLLNGFAVNWGGCLGGARVDLPLNKTITGGANLVPVGQVDCGFKDNTEPINTTCFPVVTVQTSELGSLQLTATWNINVPACMAGGGGPCTACREVCLANCLSSPLGSPELCQNACSQCPPC